MARASSAASALALLAALFSAASCDRREETRRPATDTRATPAAHASNRAPADKAPSLSLPPKITVDGRGCTIDDTALPGAPETWRDKAADLLKARAGGVAGEEVAVDVAPGARLPRVVAILAALEGAKAKGVLIRSQTRRGSDEQVALGFSRPNAPPCALVVTIEHDFVVELASAASPRADSIPRGDEGFDPARVSEALRKRLDACASPEWSLRGADTVPWAAAFELLLDLRDLAADGGARHTPVLVGYDEPERDAGRRRR